MSKIELIAAAAIGCIITTVANAEMGTGTIEDPVTHQYTTQVTKNWQEGVVLDPTTGNYIITYKGDHDLFYSIVFEPSTKVNPTIRSFFKYSQNDQVIAYRYGIHIAKTSKQGLDGFTTSASSYVDNSIQSPKDWKGSASPNSVDTNFILGWLCLKGDVVCSASPGTQLQGFALESKDLPGISVAKFTGHARHVTWLGEQPGDSAVAKQVAQLEDANFVSRNAAVPRIKVTTPFDASATLTGIKSHLDNDLATMKLVDPVLVSQLDRLLQAASDAANLGNTKAVRDDIKEARALLKKEHGDIDDDGDRDDDKKKSKSSSIDWLAAKVLNFDLKYVERRLKN